MKTKALISFAVTAKLICGFVFAYAKIQFSHDEAHISLFRIFEIFIFCFVVAICDLVHDVKTIFHLSYVLTASGNHGHHSYFRKDFQILLTRKAIHSLHSMH